MEIANPSSPVSSVPLNAGVRAVFEMAGFVVSDAPLGSEKFDLVAAPPSGPAHAVVCCANSEGMTLAELEEIQQSTRESGYEKIDVISKGLFSPEIRNGAEPLGIQLTDGNLFCDAVERLPEETLRSLMEPPSPFSDAPPSPFSEVSEEDRQSGESAPSPDPHEEAVETVAVPEFAASEVPGDILPIESSAVGPPPMSAQSHQAPPPQQVPNKPISLFDDPKPKGKGKGCLIAGIIGVVLMVGLVLVAIVAAIALPNIGRINESAKEAKDRRIAQNYASIFSSAQAAGIDFLQSPDADLQEVLARMTDGMTVADPNSPFVGTYFGVPGISPEERERAERFLMIEDGMLKYVDKSGNPAFQSGGVSVPVSRQEVDRSGMEMLTPEELALLTLEIPDDAPLWSTKRQGNVEAHLREYWNLDNIDDPEIKGFGEALLEREIHHVGGDMNYPDGQRIAEKLMKEHKQYPQLAFGALTGAKKYYQDWAYRSDELSWVAKDLRDAEMAYHLSCMKPSSQTTMEMSEIALRSLQDLLYETNGTRDIKFPISTLFDGAPGRFFELRHEEVTKIIVEHPDVPEWLKMLTAGKHYKNAAWEARGSGYADSVSPEGWKQFAALLRLAEASFSESWVQNPDHPNAPAEMIVVCMGKSASLEETRMWFDRATAIRADYSLAYDFFINYLQPKWCGSEAHLAAFGKACLDTGRFDTHIPGNIFDCHRKRSDFYYEMTRQSRLGYWQSLSPQEVSELRHLYAEREARPVHELFRRGNRSMAAVVFCACDRNEEMMEYMELLNYDIDPRAFNSMPIKMSDLQQAIQESGAMQASLGDGPSPRYSSES